MMATSDCEGLRLKAQDRIHNTAAELYQLAALMLGDESQAVDLVEVAVEQTSIDPCAEAEASVSAARVNLIETAVARLSHADPDAFEAPALDAQIASGCIEDDDLAATGISASQLASIMNSAARNSLRDWLNKLPAVQRAIFVERAILGWDNNVAAASLSRAASRSWQPRQVGEQFRRALCSLASSLVHSQTVQI